MSHAEALAGLTPMRSIAAVLALLAVALSPTEVEACSGGGGCQILQAQLGLSGVPENAPVLVAHADRPIDEGPILFGADGGVIATDLTQSPWSIPHISDRAFFIKPVAPLVVGEKYTVRSECDLRSAGFLDQPFVVTAAKPFPTTLGTLSVATGRDRRNIPGHTSLCSVPADVAFAQLTITPSAELIPFLGTTGWTLEVDGKPWARERFGTIGPDGKVEAYAESGPQTPHRLDLVHALCFPSQVEFDVGVKTGMHTATLRADVAGKGELPALEVSFALDCSGPAPVSCSSAGGSPGALALLALFAFRRRFAR